MKTKFLMASAIILASFGSVNANLTCTNLIDDKDQVLTIKQVGNLRFRLALLTADDQLASVQIIDASGNEIYGEKIVATKLNNKLFDLSNLTDGTYTFIIKKGKKVEKQNIFISTQINRSALVATN